jgi:hypothetical protein
MRFRPRRSRRRARRSRATRARADAGQLRASRAFWGWWPARLTARAYAPAAAAAVPARAAGKYLRASGLAVRRPRRARPLGADALARGRRLREVVKGARHARTPRGPRAGQEWRGSCCLRGCACWCFATAPSRSGIRRGPARWFCAKSGAQRNLALPGRCSRGTKTHRRPDRAIGEMAGSLSGLAGGQPPAAEFLAAHWERDRGFRLRNPSFHEEMRRERRAAHRIRAQDDDPGQLALRLFRHAVCATRTAWIRWAPPILAPPSRRNHRSGHRHHHGAGADGRSSGRFRARWPLRAATRPRRPSPGQQPAPPARDKPRSVPLPGREQAHVGSRLPASATDPDRCPRVLGRTRLPRRAAGRSARGAPAPAGGCFPSGADPYSRTRVRTGPPDDAVQAIRAARPLTAEGVTADESRARAGGRARDPQRRATWRRRWRSEAWARGAYRIRSISPRWPGGGERVARRISTQARGRGGGEAARRDARLRAAWSRGASGALVK